MFDYYLLLVLCLPIKFSKLMNPIMFATKSFRSYSSTLYSGKMFQLYLYKRNHSPTRRLRGVGARNPGKRPQRVARSR